MAIKDNLAKISKYLEEGASNVVQKSEELFEVSKLNIAISSEENLIKDIYIKIGKKIYKDYKQDKISDKSLVDKCKEIDEIEKDIAAIKKKILKVKDKKECKKCGALMDKYALYCPKCGREQ